MSAPLENLLSRLEKVKQTGPDQYVACCPAHEDKSPSLSIAQRDDRLLLHCFSGCSSDAVLDAIGLEFGDLYDKPISHHQKSIRRPFPAADILRAISLELTVTVMAAEQMRNGDALSDEDMARLYLAYQRVNAAIDAGGLR